MCNNNLYESANIAYVIKRQAREKKILLKEMLMELGLGSNTMSNMLHGKMLASDSLAKIADYLDCSVDYLLGRTENPEIVSPFCQLTPEEFAKVQVFAQGLLAARQIDASPKSNFLNHKEP